MPAAVQPPPKHNYRRQADTRQETLTTSTGGAPPSWEANALDAAADHDDRLKRALHRLVLVLPLSILIFAEAFEHSKEKIKLPGLELDAVIGDVIPLLLLVICYMLYRAMRYSRIVLWGCIRVGERTTTVAEIAIDDPEAFKAKCSIYEEVIDTMTAQIIGGVESKELQSVGKIAIAIFNLVRSSVLYGLIFILLGLLTVYVSHVWIVAARSIAFDVGHWLVDPKAATKALTLMLSALLLLLSWANAVVAFLIVFWLVIAPLRWIYWTGRLSPLRLRILVFCASVESACNKRLQRVFDAEMADYQRRKEQFIATNSNPEFAEREPVRKAKDWRVILIHEVLFLMAVPRR